jgi:phosphoserine phosphatase RsbU/P
MLLVNGIVVAVPSLSHRLLVLQSPVLTITLPAIAAVALYENVRGLLGLGVRDYIEPAAFTVWVLALGYVAVQRTFSDERRLLAIESELETARQIQSSILPQRVPEISNLRVAAAYQPMSAVAGDFYQFIQVDERSLAVLVADVNGHGVPAALMSSMIKVAMQSVAPLARDPSQVLCNLNRILSLELRGHLTTAAYLWIDAGKCCARYSAAGHPPLLCWRDACGQLERIESNGLLFGVLDDAPYPVFSFSVQPHDRLLLYTDGIVETENSSGESFGDCRLEQVIRDNRTLPAPDLLRNLLAEVRKWQPASAQQSDDITLIVMDIL